MENIIPTRIAGFLKDFPPFSLMDKLARLKLAEKTRVRYVQPQEFVFRQGETPSPEIFVVREGAIHLIRDFENEQILVDECDEGDLFGIRPIMAEQAYATSALAAEESLLYVIPIEEIKLIMGDNSQIAWFFAQNFAAGVRNQFDDKNKGRIFWNQSTIQIDEPSLLEVQTINHSKEPVCCSP
ncbi:MAG: cyclic nucleotide-binding domain-containing protein, partial [Bacteroidota bacterium]